jgi:membrane-bound lytic murein transglycosylase B
MASMLPTLLSMTAFPAYADYSERSDVKQFIQQMVKKHKFKAADLQQQFSRAEKLDSVLERIAKPAERTLNWKQYQKIFLTNKRINGGIDFMRTHHDLLHRAEDKYGVPAEIIAAIIGVETYYGKRSGKTAVFDSLTTLGFDYPPRAKFFRSELEQLLLLTREEDIDVKTVRGSYAGAMGMPQFISSSYRRYAVDFDGDGKRDLWNSLPDVVGSVANYFKAHGWRKGESILHPVTVRTAKQPGDNKLKPYQSVAEFLRQGVRLNETLPADARATLLAFDGARGREHWLGLKNFYVITRYNHSSLYAMAVYHLSERLKAGLNDFAAFNQ